jgi:hypothetical protein
MNYNFWEGADPYLCPSRGTLHAPLQNKINNKSISFNYNKEENFLGNSCK